MDNKQEYAFYSVDVLLGFGVVGKYMQDCRKLDPNVIIAYHHIDIGEYFCNENEL